MSASKTLASERKNDFVVKQYEDESVGKAVARAILQPGMRHGVAASGFGAKMMSASSDLPGNGDYADYINDLGKKAAKGDLAVVSQTLAAQAVTLDNIFTELARRASQNMGEYMGATETYMRLALKAQTNCRATLETLAKLHQPREQTVRHVHVNEGGKAIVADNFHHHGTNEGGGL